MKNIKIKIFIFLFLAVSLFAYWDYYHEQKEVELKLENTKIIHFLEDQINDIEILKENENIKILKTSDGWRLISPVEDWADNNYIDEMIKTLSSLRFSEITQEKKDFDLDLYSLKTPKAKIKIKDNKQSIVEVDVSSKNNFEGFPFLRISKDNIQDNKVYIGSPEWVQYSMKTPFDFREKHLFRHKLASIQKLEVMINSTTVLRFLKSDNQWKIIEAGKSLIDQNKVREFLTQIGNTQVNSYLDLNKSKDFKKSKPKMVLKMELNDKNWKASFFPDHGNFMNVELSDPYFLVQLDTGLFNYIKNTSIEQFIKNDSKKEKSNEKN